MTFSPAESRPTDIGAPTTAALFESTAAAVPELPAVRHGRDEYSYRELNALANRLARRLVRHGVGPERLVALMMPRTVEFVVAMLAVHKAGGAYVPIDPGYPVRRRSFMVADAAPRCLLRLPGQDVAGAGEMLDVDLRELREGTGHDADDLYDTERLEPLRSDQAAYVIYTSGSTGRPKGVVVAHHGILNLVTDYVPRQRLGRDSRLLAFASPSFDASVAEFWPAWAAGACLVLAPQARLIPGAPLAELLREQGVTHLTLPPSALAPLAEEGGLPAGLTLLVAGEACPEPAARRWAPGRLMINAYGPTETTVAATASDPLDGEGIPPIGRPIANTRVYVLDERMCPVPEGATGEMYVAGPGVARGYLRRPELTARRFIRDPFGPPGSRMYRTGDRARRRPDGQLEFAGRVDDQVKVRGFRIEPGEVESALLESAGLAQAAVGAHEDRLVAYVVTTSGGTEGVRDRLRDRLPEHMVPDVVVELPRLPTTPNGKIDRAALPVPGSIGTGRPPATPTEIALAGVFAEVLGTPEIGADVSFFDIGGHSLLATRAVGRIRSTLGVRLSVQAFFDAPSVSGLARVLDERNG
ncbi:non-ribosomal peptide synthetase [Amycolatopsis sp. EV170708-02-1]|uniref:non-ribosomal peptide synthetase n=1 Tax=Amycolatopsis sp. EV170708-02-1 TaxID=2919322 RepID=UPI001F0CD8D0|nr:non-ribosomal peptide synthetase [Amycolatopsis sp. EV170708-02-1]UMO99835.1 non-ribosomal peptide synthetase [Amycolatopsis sp. EV170708-02-1]